MTLDDAPATVLAPPRSSELSAFDLYSVGIGPSSSHTVGPMRAAKTFVDGLAGDGLLVRVHRVRAELFGSLGATGRGHGSEAAVLLGLEGEDPATVDPGRAAGRVALAASEGSVLLGGRHPVPFDPAADLLLHRRRSLPAHPNGMRFTAFDAAGAELRVETSYSVGGGFVLAEADVVAGPATAAGPALPYPYATADELLALCEEHGLRVSDVVLANECARRPEAEVRAGLLGIWAAMARCVDAGCGRGPGGVLPGGLGVPRRAPGLFRDLSARPGTDPLDVMDWVNLFALAVNEENASGGRVVTAPTNGAAGIVPAVLHYYVRFAAPARRAAPADVDDAIVRFLLVGAALGGIIKTGASISGAEVGCQGEVGSACAMAAGALCEVLGGTPRQVENAAEVGIEHNLGLTCDPVGGLVQIPCIERNAIAATKAINAARLALLGDGEHRVSLDTAITVMKQTGRDMHSRYKETSRGGLAVNVVAC